MPDELSASNPARAVACPRAGFAFLALAVLVWVPHDDVIDLVIRSHPVLFGRYSQGHAGALIVLTLLLAGLAALSFARFASFRERVQAGLLVAVSVLLCTAVLVIGSGIAMQPRYVETVATAEAGGKTVQGFVRQRPPDEHFELVQHDVPEQQRSYPDAPPGYPSYPLVLTTDHDGFRNRNVRTQYPVLAVGDSFVAGSNVSDAQVWTELLASSIGVPVYNLGVPGTDPGVYLNNFVVSGRKFRPALVLFMIYEGNDFKEVTAPAIDLAAPSSPDTAAAAADATESANDGLRKRFALWAKASSVTKGFERLSSEVFETIGKDKPLPGYRDKVGFMPLAVTTPDGRAQYYAFEPKRLLYLLDTPEAFRASASWQRITHILQTMEKLGEQEGFTVLFVYAPSTPHVVLPLAREAIPAQQLWNFAHYQEKHLPPPAQFKQQVFDSLDNEQQVFLDECAARQLQCLALTEALRNAASAGKQVYFTYDQHWTPDGNRVAADTIAAWVTAHISLR